jgi:ligand-binding sensor domain-containing protein/signal transduction histidine kinase
LRTLSFFPRKLCLAALALICLAGSVRALDSSRAISEYIHTQWGSEQGFPGGAVSSLAQTTDGYLWIGTEAGLIRFDGLNFMLVRNTDPVTFPIDHVLGLAADQDGSLWIRLAGPTLVRYKDGIFVVVTPDSYGLDSRGQDPHGLDPHVTAMARARNGAPLIASRQYGAFILTAGRFEMLAHAESLPSSLVVSIAQTGPREIWMGSLEDGLVRVQGERVSTVTKGLKDRKLDALLAGDRGELWVGTDRGLLRWNGYEVTQSGVPPVLRDEPILAMARDRDSNVWIGTENRGLVRLDSQGILALEQSRPGSSAAIHTILEDREGNLWIGGDQGLTRLRESLFVRYPASNEAFRENNGPAYADAQGRIWWAPRTGGLYWLKEGHHSEPQTEAGLDKDVVYSIAGGKDEMWVGRQRGGLTHLRFGSGSVEATTYTQKDGLPSSTIYSVHRNRDGSVWAGTLNAGVSLFRNGRFQNFTSADGVPDGSINSILEGTDGTTWFGTPAGLGVFARGHWQIYGVLQGLPSDNVSCLLEDSKGLMWVGTSHGIAFIQAGVARIPAGLPASLQSEILGLSEDRAGGVWISTASRVLRVDRDRMRSGSLSEDDVREYGLTDGLPSIAGVRRDHSVVTDSQGRIWFSRSRGLAMVDPARLASRSVPTWIHIEGISADGNPIDLRNPLRIPSGSRRIAIEYAGLNLSAPDRVRYRFSLDGFDHGSNPPTAGREAFYTNLGPGPYRFRVAASNAQGVWNSSEAILTFDVELAMWQTWWFRTGLVSALALTGVGLYRFRVRQLTMQLKVRFEERMYERNRIACELHDTLMQTIQASKFVADCTLIEHSAIEHSAIENPAGREKMGGALQKLSSWLAQALEEGRTALNSLRTQPSPRNGLAHDFRSVAEEIGIRTGMEIVVAVAGDQKEIHPLVSDEVYRIGYEAIQNACRHSQGSRVEVDLIYGRDFVLRVLDNGTGIDQELVELGKPGHFGLLIMRERAERVHGRLNIVSSPQTGTEIKLLVPGRVGFSERRNSSPRGKLTSI